MCFCTIILSNGRVNISVSVHQNGSISETYSSTTGNQQFLSYHTFVRQVNGHEGRITWIKATALNKTSLSIDGTLELDNLQQNTTYENNTDRPGMDYKHFSIKNSPPAACQQACLNDIMKCKAWTWVAPGVQGPDAVCWLKNGVSYHQQSNTCVSGVVFPSVNQASLYITRNISLLSTIQTSYDLINYNTDLKCHGENSPCAVLSLEDIYIVHLPKPLDYVFSASIKKIPEDIVAHWQFKCPTIMVQKSSNLIALVANPSVLNASQIESFPPFLELQNSNISSSVPSIRYGWAASSLSSHSIYGRTEGVLSWSNHAHGTLTYSIILSQEADVGGGGDFTLVASHLWEKQGKYLFYNSPGQQQNVFNSTLNLFDSWRNYAWRKTAQDFYFEFDCGNNDNTSIPCSSLATKRNIWADKRGTNQDLWLNAWFQTLRQALGMYIYGVRGNDSKIQRQALGVLKLSLKAPQTPDGAFPTIFWFGIDGSQNWVDDSGWAGLCNEIPKSHRPVDCMNFYHAFDMASTCYWMLKWYQQDTVPSSLRNLILRFVTSTADFMVTVQQPSGNIPSWFNKISPHLPAIEMRDLNAETAPVSLFLSELYNITRNISYLQAAQRAMSFIENFVVPESKWFDYETFVSCSPKPFNFYDPLTSQWPQNNLAMIQAAMAALRLFEVTGNYSRLVAGERILGRLSLTQAVWTHPSLSPILVGGFTTQNTDSEWSDNRQQYAAVLYLQYYKVTGKLEYLERSVAAMRSTFAIAPYENWAHTGGSEGDTHGALSSAINWGTCSAATAVEFTLIFLRDAFINVHHKHGVCVNGCTLRNLSVMRNSVNFSFCSPFIHHYQRHPVVIIAEASINMSVISNGLLLGNFSPQQLQTGINVPNAKICP